MRKFSPPAMSSNIQQGDPATSMIVPPQVAVVSISRTFGPVLIGAYVSLSLYGLFLHQAFQYYSLYYLSDRRWLRSLVTISLILETAVSVFHIHLTYFYFVANYENPLAFFHEIWSLNIFSTISACIMITCQSFHVTRIILLGPSKYIYLLLVVSGLLMAGAMTMSIAVTVVGFRGLTIDNFQTFLNLMLAYNAVASVGDVILTASVIYILHRSRTGLKRTDSLINRLIMYTISTGLLTTIFNILSAILIRVLGMSNWAWLGTMMVAERLYSNSLLAALNSRKFAAGDSEKRGGRARVVGRHADPFGSAVPLSTVRFDHGPSPGSSATDEELELRRPQVCVPKTKRSVLEVASESTLDGAKDDRGK